MNSSKVKNLIIVLLLMVNLALLTLTITDKVREKTIEREALAGVTNILAEHGIAVSSAVVPEAQTLPVRSVERDLKGEGGAISGILGRVTVQDQGGSIIYYSGEKGQAVFRGTGGFEMLMTEGAIPAGKDPEKTARDFLKKLGISAVTGRDSARTDVSDGTGTVVLRCRSGDTEVLGCKVTFTFTGGSLLLVVGSRPLEAASADYSQTELDVPTALLRFLTIVREGGHVCSELRSLDLCYMQTASASGQGTLIPVWRAATDAGEFYINALTGKQETLA